MKRKSILVLSATTGTGHVRAGEALVETARQSSLPIDIQHRDILDFTFPLFRKLYNDVYTTIVNTSPEIWGLIYKRTEGRRSTETKAPLIKLFDQFNYKKYLRELERMKPDAVVCTHFLPYAAIAEELRKPSWHIPFYSIPTDYYVHSLWLNESVRKFYVATTEAAWTLRASGILAEKFLATGIPIMPEFGKLTSKRAARKEFEIAPTDFTVLILSGGYGVGVMDELVASLGEFLASYGRKRFQLLVVCGKNKKLYEKLTRTKFPKNVKVTLYQFIPFIDKLMDCADVLVTKSGGLTVSEALAKHLPMVIYDPYPGQEARNAEYLVEHGAAVSAFSFPHLHFKLKHLIEQPERLKRMRLNAGWIAEPDAARRILEDVLRFTQ